VAKLQSNCIACARPQVQTPVPPKIISVILTPKHVKRVKQLAKKNIPKMYVKIHLLKKSCDKYYVS
jgi:hypothetical protein